MQATKRDPDASLIAQLQAGDTAAFAQLLERYQGKMYQLAYRYCGDHHEAYDLTQEIFVKMYRSLDRFRGDALFSTWLYRIAINCCKDYLRSRKHAAIPDEHIAERVGNPTTAATQQPDQLLHQTELQDLIRREIDALPQDWRDVVILRELEGLSYAEISEALGKPEGTIKAWLHRGRQALRERFRALQLFPATFVKEAERGEAR